MTEAAIAPEPPRAEIGQDCQEGEQAGQEVGPRGRPGHGLHAERVQGPQERGRRRAGPQRAPRPRRGAVEEPPREEVEEGRVGAMDDQVHRVKGMGVDAPEPGVEPEGEPGDRDVVAEVSGREHPPEVRPPETAKVRIPDEVVPIVPAHEGVRHDG